MSLFYIQYILALTPKIKPLKPQLKLIYTQPLAVAPTPVKIQELPKKQISRVLSFFAPPRAKEPPKKNLILISKSKQRSKLTKKRRILKKLKILSAQNSIFMHFYNKRNKIRHERSDKNNPGLKK
jgi:hypothetical protein